jgi:hypothetical protein
MVPGIERKRSWEEIDHGLEYMDENEELQRGLHVIDPFGQGRSKNRKNFQSDCQGMMKQMDHWTHCLASVVTTGKQW